MVNLKQRVAKSNVKHAPKPHKNVKSVFLPFVHKGPLYYTELRQKKMRDKLPRDYFYNASMEKLKEDLASQRLSLQHELRTELSSSMGDYSTLSATNQSKNRTLNYRRLYDFQKTPMHDRLEKNPDLLLKSAYVEDEEDLYYSEEDLVGDDALDNYSYKHK